MLQLLGIIAGILSSISVITYIQDILYGTTKPERAAWFIWTLLVYIAFFSQLSEGASDSLWLTGVLMVGITIIFLLSLKKGIGGFAKRDIIALILVSIGLILWYYTQNALFALVMVIFIDGIGMYLTIQKIFKAPKSEVIIPWIFGGLSGLFSSLAVGKLDLILLLYPFYIFLMNVAVICCILLAERRKSN